jgi:hypothetical protein
MHLLVIFLVVNHQCMVMNRKIQNYNFAFRFIRVFFLVCQIEGRTLAKGVGE